MLGDVDVVLRKAIACHTAKATLSFGLSLITLPRARFGGIELAGTEIALSARPFDLCGQFFRPSDRLLKVFFEPRCGRLHVEPPGSGRGGAIVRQ
jgi:hypothetical protein